MNIQNKFKKTNTIYKITKDMDLEGSTLIIPVGCTLDFQGGSFKNGVINFNDTLLKGRVNIDCDVLTGTIKNEQIYVNWFNVDNTGISENTALINHILQTAINKTVIFDGIYKIDPIASSSKEYDGGIRPISNQTLKFTDRSKLIIDKQSTLYFSILSIYRVENVSIYGANIEGDINTHSTDQGEYGFGVAISSSKNINLYNCKSSYNWGDGYIFLSTGSGESNNFDCNLYNCEAHYNRRQGLSIVALYGGRIDNFKATNTGILKYTAPAAGIDIEPDAIRYDERIKVTINNYTSENNFGGALHIVPAHLMHDNVTDDHREFYVQVNGLSSNLDGSRNTSVLLPALRYSSVTTDSNLQNKIKGLVELNNITISNSYMNPLEFRSMVDNGLPIVINGLTVLNPKVDSSFAKSMSAVLKFYNPTTYDYTNSTELTINGIKVTDTRTDNRVSYLMFSTFGNSPKNIHLFNVDNPSMDGGSNIPYLIDDSSEIHYSVPPVYTVNNDDNFLLSNNSNNYWGYKIIFNNPSVKSFRLPKGSTVSNFEITVENIQQENVVHSRFIPGDKINEPLVYNRDPSFELLPNSSIKFIQRKDESWDIIKSTDNIIPTLNPYYGSSKQAVGQYSNPILGHSYYDTNLDTTLNYGNDGWQNPDGTNVDKVIFASRNTSFVASKTIYKIVSDIDLNGETLTLPANVTLDFQGGSISNGVITGSSIKNTYLRPEWFGAKGDGITDDSVAFQMTVNLCKSTNCKVIELSESTYLIDNVIIPSNITLIGADKYKSILKSYANTLNTPILASDDTQGNNIVLRNLTIESSGIRTEYTVKILNKVGVIIDNCYFVRHTIEGDPNDYHGIFIGRKEGTETTYITKFTNNRVNQCCVTIEGTDGYIDHNEIWGIGCQSALHLVKSGNHMISNNQIVGGSVYGAIYCTEWATALKLFGNYFDGSSTIVANVPYGLNVDCNLTYCTISNNNFWHIYGTAIRVKTCIGSVFNGNIFENNDTADTGAPDILLENTQSSSVSNNSFIRANVTRTNKAPVLNITGYTSTSYEPIIISGNIMRGYLNYSSAVYTPIDSVIKSINNNSQYFEYIKNNSPYRIFTSDGEINYISSTDISADPLASRVYTYLEGGRKPRLDNLTYIDAGNMPTSSKFDFSATYNKDFKLYIGSTTQVDNAPTWLTGGVWLENYYTANGYCVQRIFSASMIYTRTCNNNIWSSWYKIEGTALT